MLGFSLEGWFFFVLGVLVALAFTWLQLKWGRPKGAQMSILQHGLVVLDRPNDPTLHADVIVNFKGQSIPRLSACKVTVWNSGDTVIDRRMFVKDDPLQLSTIGDTIVLDAQIINDPQRGKRDISVQTMLDTSKSVYLDFEFLNPREGFTVKILHTCARPMLSLSGTLKGARIVDTATVASTYRNRFLSSSLLVAGVAIAVALGTALAARKLGIDEFYALPLSAATVLLWPYIGGGKLINRLLFRDIPTELLNIPDLAVALLGQNRN